MHLVEISVMEHRYQAVMAVVQDGWKITEVAERLGVSRQAVHRWIARYDAGGLSALESRSHRPSSCAHQIRATARPNPPRSRLRRSKNVPSRQARS